MAYNLKYWNEFKNYYDETIRIEILGRDWPSGGADTYKFIIKYGALYNQYAISNIKNLAAVNAHIPSKSEYDNLRTAYNNIGYTGASPYMVTGVEYWNTPNNSATNLTGFNARGSGIRLSDGFSLLKDNVYWWVTDVEIGGSERGIVARITGSSYSFQTGLYFSKSNGASVRLIIDTPNTINGINGTYIGNDNKEYSCKLLADGKWWLVQDLSETKYRDGSLISIITDETNWNNNNTGAICYYDNTENNSGYLITINGNDNSTQCKTLSTPLVLSYPGDDDNLFNPIIGSQVTINLLSTSNFQFVDLHNSDARAHRVDIYKESVLDWTGWVLPDLFSEPYIAPPYPVSITARCGLGELKEKTLADYSISSIPTLLNIISTFLLSIETATTLNESINVFYDSNDSVNDSPLNLTKINISAYGDKTPYEVISDILSTFGARLYQMGGEWWIVRAKEIAETLTVRIWDLEAGTFTVDETQLKTFLISRPAASQIVNESPQLDINPAWKKFKWVQDLQIKESFILNNKFDIWEPGIISTLSNWTTQGAGIGIPPLNQLMVRAYNKEGNQYAYFNSFNTANYIYQQNDWTSINTGQLLKLVITFDLFVTNPAILTGDFKIIVKNYFFINAKYLALNTSTGEFYWTTTPTEINFNNATVTHPLDSNGNQEQENFRTETFLFPMCEMEGFLRVEIYPSSIAFLRLSEFSISVVKVGQEPYQEQLETEIIVNNNNIYNPENIELVGGDLPNIENAELIWGSGYRKLEYWTPTAEWHERGSGVELPLLQLIGTDYKNIFQTPQYKLSIPILSRSIQFDSCIVDYLVLPKKYICASAEIDYQTCIFSGTFMEFSEWEGAPWILADGSWNDEGIWVDDDVWNDDNTNSITVPVTGLGYHDLTYLVSPGDVIETLPFSAPALNIFLYEDGDVILSAPHTFTGTELKCAVDPIAIIDYQNSFNATLSGDLKTIKILVTL